MFLKYKNYTDVPGLGSASESESESECYNNEICKWWIQVMYTINKAIMTYRTSIIM